MDELLDALKDLDRAMGLLKTQAQADNRERLIGDKSYLLSEDFEDEYFLSLKDEGWEISLSKAMFNVNITLTNALKREGIQQTIEELILSMEEIRDRFKDEGYQSKFLIYLNGREQQSINHSDYSMPNYAYYGIGNIGNDSSLNYYKDGYYSDEEYAYCRVTFVII